MADALPARCAWPRRAPVAAVLLTLACAGGASEPSGRELVGNWGSSEAELIGLYAGAELRLPCTRIIIDDPILLNDDNEFEARARVDGPGLRAGSIPVVRLTGRAAGSQVTIHVPASSETAEATYLLEAGTVPPPLLEPVCPL